MQQKRDEDPTHSNPSKIEFVNGKIVLFNGYP